jgi:hypothetical protein
LVNERIGSAALSISPPCKGGVGVGAAEGLGRIDAVPHLTNAGRLATLANPLHKRIDA